MATNGATNGDSSSSLLKGNAPEFIPRYQGPAQHEMGPNYAPEPQDQGLPAYGQYNGCQFNNPLQYQPMPDFYPVPVNGAYPPPPPPTGQYYPHQATPWPAGNGGPVHSLDPFSHQLRLVEEMMMVESAQPYHEDYNYVSEPTIHAQNNHRKKGKKPKKNKKAKKTVVDGGVGERNGERVQGGVEQQWA